MIQTPVYPRDLCRVTDAWCAEQARAVVARLNHADRQRRRIEDAVATLASCALLGAGIWGAAWLLVVLS